MKMTNKRFTLIELIIVIVVIGILAGMALPKFMGVQRDAKAANLKNDCDVLQTVAALVETNRNQTEKPYGSNTESEVNSLSNTKLKELLTAKSATKIATLDETAYKDNLSKLPKTGALADFKVVLDGDLAGTIVYDKDDAGIVDGKGTEWFGVDLSK